MTSNPRSRTRLGALGLAAALALAGCGTAASAQSGGGSGSNSARTVTATATGSATGVPDQMTVQVGIANEGASASDVLAENSRKTQALIDDLKGAGIAEEDIATTSVTFGPRYDREGNIDGYRAENSLRVTLRDLKTAGQRLDAVVRVGGNDARVNGISLGFDEDDALLSKARADAVKRAKVQAQEMAKAAGADVGRVRTITDVTTSGGEPLPYADAAGAAADSSTPIQAGTQDLTVQVRVVFELS